MHRPRQLNPDCGRGLTGANRLAAYKARSFLIFFLPVSPREEVMAWTHGAMPDHARVGQRVDAGRRSVDWHLA